MPMRMEKKLSASLKWGLFESAIMQADNPWNYYTSDSILAEDFHCYDRNVSWELFLFDT